jgi:hypothetical protein
MDLGPLMGAEKWGIPDNPASNSPSALAAVPAPSVQGAAAAKLTSPENPLFWFGVLGLVTTSLMAFSTTVRVGKTAANLSVGSV